MNYACIKLIDASVLLYFSFDSSFSQSRSMGQAVTTVTVNGLIEFLLRLLDKLQWPSSIIKRWMLIICAPVSSLPPVALHLQISYKYLPVSLAAHVFPAAQFFLCLQPQSDLLPFFSCSLRTVSFVICICDRHHHGKMTQLPHMHIHYFLIWYMSMPQYLWKLFCSFGSISWYFCKCCRLDHPWSECCIKDIIIIYTSTSSRKSR